MRFILLACCLSALSAGAARAQECRSDWPDTDGDCRITVSDLAVVLLHFQRNSVDCRDGDFDRDGDVDVADLAAVLAHFGRTCPMQAALTTTGVAPLRVYFSAQHPSILQPGEFPTGSNDYHSFDYRWDFGDPNRGRWPYGIGDRSRNAAAGVNAAHLYEEPGTYTVTMRLTTERDLRQTYQQQIQVLPFIGRTYYVAADGADDNDGLSRAAPIRTFARAMELLAVEQDAPLQILFRRGDQFLCDFDNLVGNRNPVRIGAYGDDADRPTIHVAPDSRAFWFEYTDDPRDFVIRDLAFLGPASEFDTREGFLHCNGRQARGICVLNCVAEELAQPVLINYGYGSPTRFECDPNRLHSDIWILDSHFRSSYRWLTWAGGNRLVFLGNHYAGTVVDHTMRIWRGHRALLQHCRLEAPGSLQQTLKWHNNSNNYYCPPSRYSIVSDNEFVGRGGFVITFGNQDEVHIEETDDVLFERNLVEFSEFCQRGLMINGRYAMVRNNVFNLGHPGVCFVYAMSSTHRGSQFLDDTSTFDATHVQPPPVGNRFLHNTVVVDTLRPGFAACTPDPNVQTSYREVTAVDLDGSRTPENTDNYYMVVSRECTARNNWVIVTAENVALIQTVFAGGFGDVIAGNLVSLVDTFVDAAARDWTPAAGSPSIDSGSERLPGAWFDLVGLQRDPRPDAGAYERAEP